MEVLILIFWWIWYLGIFKGYRVYVVKDFFVYKLLNQFKYKMGFIG